MCRDAFGMQPACVPSEHSDVFVAFFAAEGGTLAVEHLAMSTSKQQASQPIMPKSNLPVSDPVVARPKPPDRLTLGPIKKGGSEPPVVRK